MLLYAISLYKTGFNNDLYCIVAYVICIWSYNVLAYPMFWRKEHSISPRSHASSHDTRMIKHFSILRVQYLTGCLNPFWGLVKSEENKIIQNYRLKKTKNVKLDIKRFNKTHLLTFQFNTVIALKNTRLIWYSYVHLLRSRSRSQNVYVPALLQFILRLSLQATVF